MNKTIFNLSDRFSIIIMGLFGIILGFLANAFYVNTFISYLLYILRAGLFLGAFIISYVLEKRSMIFKIACKRMLGYLLICYSFNLLCTLFSLTHILKEVFLTISGLVCFWTILVFALEILSIFFNQKWISKFQMINEKIGLAIANPIVRLIQNKTTSD